MTTILTFKIYQGSKPLQIWIIHNINHIKDWLRHGILLRPNKDKNVHGYAVRERERKEIWYGERVTKRAKRKK